MAPSVLRAKYFAVEKAQTEEPKSEKEIEEPKAKKEVEEMPKDAKAPPAVASFGKDAPPYVKVLAEKYLLEGLREPYLSAKVALDLLPSYPAFLQPAGLSCGKLDISTARLTGPTSNSGVSWFLQHTILEKVQRTCIEIQAATNTISHPNLASSSSFCRISIYIRT
jgi:hypothetical protein